MATGISQGSPLSPILYLFYNADMLEELTTANEKALVLGYVDDICILTWSKTVRENYALLRRIHARAEAWEATHASKFSPAKYGLINMTRQVAPARRGSQPPGIQGPLRAAARRHPVQSLELD